MGPDLELNSKSENIHAPSFSGQKHLDPGINYIDDACCMEKLPMEQPPLSTLNEDVEVNIIGCTNSGKGLVVEDSCDDVTEGSSSFGDTGSGTENAPSFGDTEVESRLCTDNASSSMFDDCCESPQRRKKRVTTHWRRFIRPLMWRCKWIELQLKQLQSQALKYDKELESYNYTKQLDFVHLTLDGSDIKSVPISGRMHRNKIMKRNRRDRVEEKCDLASYMCNHSVFSYYELTDRTAGACLKDFRGVAIGGNIDDNDFKLDDLWSCVDYEISDQSLNDIIQKIEALQSQVHKLKTRTGKVISENSGKFDSVTQLNVPGPSQLQPEYHMGDLLVPRKASLSCDGVTPHIETTERSELEVPWEDDKDGALIQQNQAAKKELHDLENVRNHLVKETKESVENNKSISQAQVSKYELAANEAVPNVQTSMKLCSILKSNVPRNKRKRRKKCGSKIWSQRSSG